MGGGILQAGPTILRGYPHPPQTSQKGGEGGCTYRSMVWVTFQTELLASEVGGGRPRDHCDLDQSPFVCNPARPLTCGPASVHWGYVAADLAHSCSLLVLAGWTGETTGSPRDYPARRPARQLIIDLPGKNALKKDKKAKFARTKRSQQGARSLLLIRQK